MATATIGDLFGLCYFGSHPLAPPSVTTPNLAARFQPRCQNRFRTGKQCPFANLEFFEKAPGKFGNT